ncbi:MAG: hypothetical protein HZB17_02875 [Chloroflexi bacterium]|nr:hypothetical protein [Chloroflexota bacterium]
MRAIFFLLTFITSFTLTAFQSPTPTRIQLPISNLQSPILQSSLTFESFSVTHTFGSQITFNVTAKSDADVTAAAVLMRSGDSDRTEVIQASVTPSKNFKGQVTRELQAQPISPFTTITYSWRLTDSQGRTFTSAEQTYTYDDNRFKWQTLERGAIIAHWYTGDLTFGQYIADTGFKSLERVSRFINAPLPPKVNVYVYANLNDLQSSLRLIGRTWVSGYADPKIGVVMVAASPDLIGRSDLERDVPHELAHIMIYQATRSGYDRMPVWLDEGLAVNSELQPRPDFAAALSEAVKNNSLIPIASLCGSFGNERAHLSYAESASLVRYILDRRGGAVKIKGLLNAYRDGATCEGGVQQELKVSLIDLQTDWQREVLNSNPLLDFWRNAVPGLVIFVPVALIIALFIFVPKQK